MMMMMMMMDSEVSVLLHCAAWRGLLESQVQVELSERFNRQTDPALERQIEEVWTERASKEPWLFNGSKFRLHSFCLASPFSVPPPLHIPFSDGAEKQEGELQHSRHRTGENSCINDCNHYAVQGSLDKRNKAVSPRDNAERVSALSQASSESISAELPSKTTDDEETALLLTLRLGLTCYKDYLGTNWSSCAPELRQRGEVERGDPLALLAQPLGVGGVLCTHDSQVVFIRRSQRVAEAGGQLDIPGGHPEPKVVCERLGRAVCEEQISVDMMQQRPVEVNIPLSSLGEPVLMGVALNHTSAGRPSAEFYVSCSLTSDEVRKLYWKGGAEAHESTDIVFLSRTEVLQLDRSSPLWSELCPSAKGAVLLYQTVKPDTRNDALLIASENETR
ncbi:uridine diphosphate glucose pyrophosphatase NUDT22 isoform X2 [Centropristis striata]|uniref:uridine diphosphate glucose pyrophosphatase NUDT22 isoform X2 n=1 Tax=Centropristis striata TaxID=184440 RepID=UPI0027DF5CDC|nr:uridine diphosphate glucose pyrophosphatase NUDT22 isoform X2 [Centropristis striata]